MTIQHKNTGGMYMDFTAKQAFSVMIIIFAAALIIMVTAAIGRDNTSETKNVQKEMWEASSNLDNDSSSSSSSGK